MDFTNLKKGLVEEIIQAMNEGGSGSGNWGHKGRPGKRGGSLPGGQGTRQRQRVRHYKPGQKTKGQIGNESWARFVAKQKAKRAAAGKPEATGAKPKKVNMRRTTITTASGLRRPLSGRGRSALRYSRSATGEEPKPGKKWSEMTPKELKAAERRAGRQSREAYYKSKVGILKGTAPSLWGMERRRVKPEATGGEPPWAAGRKAFLDNPNLNMPPGPRNALPKIISRVPSEGTARSLLKRAGIKWTNDEPGENRGDTVYTKRGLPVAIYRKEAGTLDIIGKPEATGGWSNKLFRAARKVRDLEVVASGSPKKMLRRAANKIIGRKTRKGFLGI